MGRRCCHGCHAVKFNPPTPAAAGAAPNALTNEREQKSTATEKTAAAAAATLRFLSHQQNQLENQSLNFAHSKGNQRKFSAVAAALI